MTMAELYAALEKLDGGAAMVETIKAEVGKLNVESKEQREAKEKAEALVKTLTEAKDTLANQIAELQKPGAGEQTAEYKTLLKKFDDLSKSFETEKAARQEAEQKRIQTDIMAQTVDALTKHNAMDPKEFAKLIVGGIDDAVHVKAGDVTPPQADSGVLGRGLCVWDGDDAAFVAFGL